MPAWLISLGWTFLSYLAKAVLPIVLKDAVNKGNINSVEAWGIKTGTHILTATKVEDTYAPDKNTGIVTGDINAPT